MKTKLDIEEVKRLYLEQKLPVRKISELLNCGYGTIHNAIKKLGLTREKIKSTKSQRVIDLKTKIKDMYLNDKMSSYEIAEKLNLAARTVTYHLHDLGVEIRPVKKVDQAVFEKLWSEGKTDEEIAEHFGTSVLTIRSFRTKGKNAGKFNVKRYFAQEEHHLSKIQEQMILGSLLGDMSLSSSAASQNKNLSLVHCKKQEELFMEKVKILGEFMGSYKFRVLPPDPRTGKQYESWRGNSKTHPVFTQIYNKLYTNGVKTITKEYLNKIQHPIALAYWFMDDGSYCGTIATNCFSLTEDELLKEWLFNRWGIETSIHPVNIDKGQYCLYIKNKSREFFDNLIYPYIVPSMRYKLKYLPK